MKMYYRMYKQFLISYCCTHIFYGFTQFISYTSKIYYVFMSIVFLFFLSNEFMEILTKSYYIFTMQLMSKEDMKIIAK